MITDRQNQLSSAQALTSGTIVATDCVDLGVNRDAGAGEPLFLVLTVDVGFVGGTSVTPQIITGTGVSTTINAGVQVLGSGPAIPTASLVQGAIFVLPVPPRNPQDKGARYLGAQYVVSGSYSQGSITAHLVHDVQHINKQYPGGFAVA